jgi:hypothetical protein
MSTLAEVAAAVDPALREHLAAEHPDVAFADVTDPHRRFTLEAVYEGYLLHYGEPRLLVGMEPDLQLLAGDAMYALGLSRVAQEGDLEAVSELADLITATAKAHAEGDGSAAERHWSESARRLA